MFDVLKKVFEFLKKRFNPTKKVSETDISNATITGNNKIFQQANNSHVNVIGTRNNINQDNRTYNNTYNNIKQANTELDIVTGNESFKSDFNDTLRYYRSETVGVSPQKLYLSSINEDKLTGLENTIRSNIKVMKKIKDLSELALLAEKYFEDILKYKTYATVLGSMKYNQTDNDNNPRYSEICEKVNVCEDYMDKSYKAYKATFDK